MPRGDMHGEFADEPRAVDDCCRAVDTAFRQNHRSPAVIDADGKAKSGSPKRNEWQQDVDGTRSSRAFFA